MKKVVPLLLLAACAAKPAAAPAVSAQSVAAPSVPLVGELARLQFYVGDWACTGQQNGGIPWQAEVHVRSDAGGHLLAVHMVGPGDNLTSEIKGRNDQTGAWFHLWADHTGAWGSATAQFWDGDSLTSIDDVSPKHRTIFTKLSDTKYTHRDEQDMGAGWELDWEKTCEKISGS